jgi:hypothetical protein
MTLHPNIFCLTKNLKVRLCALEILRALHLSQDFFDRLFVLFIHKLILYLELLHPAIFLSTKDYSLFTNDYPHPSSLQDILYPPYSLRPSLLLTVESPPTFNYGRGESCIARTGGTARHEEPRKRMGLAKAHPPGRPVLRPVRRSLGEDGSLGVDGSFSEGGSIAAANRAEQTDLQLRTPFSSLLSPRPLLLKRTTTPSSFPDIFSPRYSLTATPQKRLKTPLVPPNHSHSHSRPSPHPLPAHTPPRIDQPISNQPPPSPPLLPLPLFVSGHIPPPARLFQSFTQVPAKKRPFLSNFVKFCRFFHAFCRFFHAFCRFFRAFLLIFTSFCAFFTLYMRI